jgi:hypothetical protein
MIVKTDKDQTIKLGEVTIHYYTTGDWLSVTTPDLYVEIKHVRKTQCLTERLYTAREAALGQ